MGAGCYYTNKETGTKAFWIDFERPEQNEYEYDFQWDNLIHDIGLILEKLNYYESGSDKLNHFNGLFEVVLESPYNGDGVVIRLEPHTELESNVWNLAMANHERSYKRIAKALTKAGYKLRVANSSYTSMEYLP